MPPSACATKQAWEPGNAQTDIDIPIVFYPRSLYECLLLFVFQLFFSIAVSCAGLVSLFIFFSCGLSLSLLLSFHPHFEKNLSLLVLLVLSKCLPSLVSALGHGPLLMKHKKMNFNRWLLSCVCLLAKVNVHVCPCLVSEEFQTGLSGILTYHSHEGDYVLGQNRANRLGLQFLHESCVEGSMKDSGIV